MDITNFIYQMLLAIHSVPPEIGGILGSHNGIITEVCFDKNNLRTDFAVYQPDSCFLNDQIRNWYENGILFAGMFHSHPEGQETLSLADRRYIFDLMNQMVRFTDKLFFPIVIPKKEIIVYYAEKKNFVISIKKDECNIIL